MDSFRDTLAAGRSVAFVIRKGALTCDEKTVYHNGNQMTADNKDARNCIYPVV